MEYHHLNESGTAGAETGQVVSAMTLRSYLNRFTSIEPEVFMTIARSLTASVGKLHQQQTLHLDLRPERIGIHPATLQVDLLDLGNAAYRTTDGYIRSGGTGVSEASLPYCSPENTGRMQRPIDERSDLYSLGVIFYEMLAGCLPFQANNPLEWVYLHLAQSPKTLEDHRTDLPDHLSSIVMKLLEKNPDNRCQSAGLLIAEFDKVGRSREMAFMDPGFHGREVEISILTQAFYSACFGSTEMVYVSGEAGIGKTSLLEEMFRKQQQTRHFHYITGKFEQLSNGSPYHPIIQAFRGLIRHLLGEPKDRVEQWTRKLREALGASANVMIAIIPEIELLLGVTAAVEELPAHESQKRFIYAFRKFVQALATKEYPLVLFIDDLQWADTSSLQLIHELLCDPECQYLMFVCAYRHTETDRSTLPGYDNESRVTHQAVVRHIHLSPLNLMQMNLIMMETLHSRPLDALPLTELLYHLSRGNPFHFKHILIRLQDEGSLYYNHENRCWQWDLGRIIEQEPSYAIHDLMLHRLRRLSSDAREMLNIAACVGSAFHPSLIARVKQREIEDMRAAWHEIESEGMIIPFETEKYRFAHDHIQRLIYNQIDEDTLQATHLQIGRCLNEIHPTYAENPFDAVNHLNWGTQKITDAQEILDLANMNLAAGNRAMSSSAYDVALGYFSKGVALLSQNAWDDAFDLLFELHAQKAECEYLCGNYTVSDQDIDFLLGHARNPAERSKVQMIRIRQYVNQGKYLEGTALGLESLREHRIFISPHPGSLTLLIEAMRIEMLLHNRYDKLTHLKEMSDPDRIIAMNLIFAIAPSTFFTNKKVYFLLMCRAIQLSLQYGNTPVSAAAYSGFGMILGTAKSRFDKGYAIGEIAKELSEQSNIPSVKSKTYTIFGGVLCQFVGDAHEGDAYLTRALRFGMESGDYVFASYAMGAHVNSLYVRASLSELARTIADYMAVLDTTKDEFIRQNFHLYQQVILALQGRTDAPDSFNGGTFDEEEFLSRIYKEETSATTLFQYSTYKAQLHYLLGNPKEAIHWAREAKTYIAYATHLPHLPECLFYESLAILADDPPSENWPRMKKNVIRNIRRFGKWVKWSPANFQPRHHLLQAELARVNGELNLAEALYDKAIREAREQSDIRTTSLASELAANHYWSRGHRKTALHYFKMAVEGFRQWEVHLKTRQLEERLLHWQQQEVADLTADSSPTMAGDRDTKQAEETTRLRTEPAYADNIDLAAILNTTQTISNLTDTDAMLAEIMNTLMKHAGASKGALLTGSNDELYIQVYADAEVPTVPSPLELTDSSLLPEGIIRYVFRTQEEVLYARGGESWLIHNPYIAKRQPQSVLCIPVMLHGTMLGVLYLENRLASGVFTRDHMAVLLAMASYGILMCVLQGSSEPTYTETDSAEEVPPPDRIEEPLTERELEVLALLASGLSNKEIADHLIIAIGTVKVHVKNIFAKLKVNRRTKAIAQAKELNLLV